MDRTAFAASLEPCLVHPSLSVTLLVICFFCRSFVFCACPFFGCRLKWLDSRCFSILYELLVDCAGQRVRPVSILLADITMVSCGCTYFGCVSFLSAFKTATGLFFVLRAFPGKVSQLWTIVACGCRDPLFYFTCLNTYYYSFPCLESLSSHFRKTNKALPGTASC